MVTPADIFTPNSLANFLNQLATKVENLERNSPSVKYHSDLSGLQQRDHLNFALLDGSQPFTGPQTFNGLVTMSAGASVTGDITVTGTVDGINISTKDAANETDHTTYDAYAATIAAKLPLAGGTMSGLISFLASQTFDGVDVSVLNATVAAMANFIKCSDAAGYVVDVGTQTVNCTTGYGAHASLPTEYHWYYGDTTSINHSESMPNRVIPIALAASAWCAVLSTSASATTFRVFRPWASTNGVTVYYMILGT